MTIILPINDIQKHEEESTTCACKPRVEFINGEMLIIHNSFDGRELEEQINEILNNDSESAQSKHWLIRKLL